MNNVKFIVQFFTGFLSSIFAFVTACISCKLNMQFMSELNTTTGGISSLIYIPFNSVIMLISTLLAITAVISLALCIPQSYGGIKAVVLILFILAIGVFAFGTYNFAVFANLLGSY